MTERERFIGAIKKSLGGLLPHKGDPGSACASGEKEDKRSKLKFPNRKLIRSEAWDDAAEGIAERIADALMQDGAVFPGCKVGDTAYFVIYDSVEDKWHISAEPIVDVCTKGFYTSGHEDSTENGDLWEWSEVGETVFFSNEEAEKAIAGRGDKDA